MKDTGRSEDWRVLCEQASHESDPQKLLELVAKVNDALEVNQRGRTDESSSQVDTVLLPTSRSGQYDFELYRFTECSTQLEHDC